MDDVDDIVFHDIGDDDDGGRGRQRPEDDDEAKLKRVIKVNAAAIAVIAVIIAVIIGVRSSGGLDIQSGQSSQSSQSSQSGQSGAITDNDIQASEDSKPEAFRRAVTEERIKEAESQYDMTFIDKLDDSVNPMKASPYGVYAYNVSVPQEWKDTYGDNWQTITTATLNNLGTLWGDSSFRGKAFDVSSDVVTARMNALDAVSDRDEFVNRLAPPSGFEWAGNTEKTTPTSDDFAYYYGIVPILDDNGYVPGTTFAPKSTDWDVRVTSIKLDGNDYTGTGVYAEYPRFEITREVIYDGTTSAVQNLTVWVNNVNGEWKLIQVEGGPITLGDAS